MDVSAAPPAAAAATAEPAPAAAGEGPAGAARGAGGGGGGGRRVVHRLAVFNALGEITHIVSQTDVLRHLLKHRDAIGPVGARPISDLGLLEGKGPLVALQPHTPTLLAFEQLAAAGEKLPSSCAARGAGEGGPPGQAESWVLGRALTRLSAAACVTGAPVIASDGELIANLSVSDIRLSPDPI
ncbi:hypothetical protein MNEG_13104 [Monoraphidium neglectum]|uniref:CBS domain-containing protein n=1 Tax=Monoraphidium neglectum TaxID=145388 RepID=A0A0D2LT87_9CHLO|nr:hypothetical protein MNEG_13104 [Monoraphidium neglectum]KIY94859.1 hypothetical protein MNEG_13104 [Monoraphidium neglectum]|eukprot:XP_013893879.1 hypothetical protein MNEG_13104 [Monoraphidium neglectum]